VDAGRKGVHEQKENMGFIERKEKGEGKKMTALSGESRDDVHHPKKQ